MITTVTFNPAIDRTVCVEALRTGAVNRVISSRADMGGKGINVARILLALGSQTVAAGFIGARNLSLSSGLLARDGIVADLVRVDAETRQNIKLVENSNHQTTDINEPGFHVSAADLAELTASIRRHAENSDYLVLSGSVPPGVPVTIYRDIALQLPATCKVVIDADGQLLRNGLSARPYLIKPNIHELENALGCSLPTSAAIGNAAKDLIGKYQIHSVLVSMGENGSILATQNTVLHAAALKVKVRNTVGAGDTMLAGFIHSSVCGLSERDALAFATACGALAVSQEGNETISIDQISSLAGQVAISDLSQ